MKTANSEAPKQMVSMLLKRHYRPAGEFEVVGHTRPEIRRKDPSGKETIVQEKAWLAGAAMPPPVPGAGYKDKIWAGTVVRLAREEALRVQEAEIGVSHLA